MGIKIIFFDIDGTLISKQHMYMTKGVIQECKRLQEKGIKICIATGRHASEIEELDLPRQFPFDAYVTLNGNYCYDQEHVIYSNPIHKQDVINCVNYVENNHLACLFVEHDRMYMNRVTDMFYKIQEVVGTPNPIIGSTSEALAHDIYQISPFFVGEDLKQMLETMPHCKATCWHPLGYDIIHYQGGKHIGISHVLDYFGFTKDEAMAFGDEFNDIEMLDYVTHAVVMGNAKDEVKQHAEYVTNDVDHAGIEQAFQHYKL